MFCFAGELVYKLEANKLCKAPNVDNPGCPSKDKLCQIVRVPAQTLKDTQSKRVSPKLTPY